MDATKLILSAIGAFYAFAGYVATRAALTSHFIDRAIAAIGGTKAGRTDMLRSYWLLASGVLVLAGGVALAFLLDVAAWLFVAASAGQALYLFYVAPRFLDAEDPPDAAGRRSSTNAFVLYLAATAFVLWALSTGKLLPWQEAGWPVLALFAAAVLVHAGYVMWTLARAPAAAAGGALGLADDAPDPAQSARIKVMADYLTYPLWAMDEGVFGAIDPEALDLSSELVRDLNDWADAFTASIDPDDPARSLWSEAERAAHAAKARPLAVRLKREKPDRIIYVHTDEVGVVEVAADEEI